jgi:hypothetical protein
MVEPGEEGAGCADVGVVAGACHAERHGIELWGSAGAAVLADSGAAYGSINTEPPRTVMATGDCYRVG